MNCIQNRLRAIEITTTTLQPRPTGNNLRMTRRTVVCRPQRGVRFIKPLRAFVQFSKMQMHLRILRRQRARRTRGINRIIQTTREPAQMGDKSRNRRLTWRKSKRVLSMIQRITRPAGSLQHLCKIESRREIVRPRLDQTGVQTFRRREI